MGRSTAAAAIPFVSVAEAIAVGVLLLAEVYRNETVPVGVPATEDTVAVSVTGAPSVAMVLFAASVVTVSAGVITRALAADAEPPLSASPL
jgi:hypothetical protein